MNHVLSFHFIFFSFHSLSLEIHGKGEHWREIGGVLGFSWDFFVDHIGFYGICGSVSRSIEVLRA